MSTSMLSLSLRVSPFPLLSSSIVPITLLSIGSTTRSIHSASSSSSSLSPFSPSPYFRVPSSTVPFRSFSSVSSSPSPSSPSSSSLYRTPCGLYVDPTLPRTFTKILIANRGEIACRVIRTCKELGISTVAVYSEVDRHARHVQMADEAYLLGESPAQSSYLKGEKILEIAKLSGAQAIHPGYGFLSENAAFAKQCEASGIEFIGPPASAIEAMGSKSGSKVIMTKAKVPVVPGYWGRDQSPETLRKEASKCGYPIMLKAVSGGGGKGMRIVHNDEEFLESLESCKREALSSFKDDRVLLERYIVRPRHIEFQVFADKHGNVVHFWQRDCSVQRRHQKVLEEAPAPGMSDKLREEMGLAAVNAARAVGYVGAGTVEFIFDATTDEYFFMEMNTRLQVEHPVTEMIMRRDLVQLQLHVAFGHKMAIPQSSITAHGHAIEARIYAENPHNNFLPATGHLVHLSPPLVNEYTRVESGVRQGDTVSIFYDPMIAKLVIWGPNRDAALQRMKVALLDYQIVGPPNNIQFLRRAIDHPKFHQGKVETGFIAQNLRDLVPLEEPKHVVNTNFNLSIVALLLREQYQYYNDNSTVSTESSPTSGPHTNTISSVPSPPPTHNPFHLPNSFRVNQPSTPRPVELNVVKYSKDGELQEEKMKATVSYHHHQHGQHGDWSQWKINDEVAEGKFQWEDATLTSGFLKATVGGQSYSCKIVFTDDSIYVFHNGGEARFKIPEIHFEGPGVGGHALAANSPMAGKIVKVAVTKGQQVKKGQQLVVMEAMKMEHVIRAAMDGTIADVAYKVGDFVEGGKPLVKFEAKQQM